MERHYPTMNANTLPSVVSILDTDFLKLTMQCAVLKYFPNVEVEYALDNRTPQKKMSRAAYKWLETQVQSRFFSALSIYRIWWFAGYLD